MKVRKNFRRSFYLFKGKSRYRLVFRGMKMDFDYLGESPPANDLDEVARWAADRVEEVKKELGIG